MEAGRLSQVLSHPGLQESEGIGSDGEKAQLYLHATGPEYKAISTQC